jgi:hypothetical protein
MGSAGWQVVGYPDDPIPDDPGVVATQIAHLRSVAANIATQVAALPQSGQVDALVWSSQNNDAPQQFRKLASQLPQDLDQLRTRYVKVANALDQFHPVLVQTQGQARANLTVALAAHQDMQAAQTGVQQMNDFQYQAQQAAANQNRDLPAGKPPVQPATWTGPNYPAMLTDATTRFNNAKGQIDLAVQHFNGASQTAADQVNSASNDGLKNQSSGWGIFGDVVKWTTGVGEAEYLWDHRKAIGKEIDPVLEDVAQVTGTLSALAGLVAMLPIPGVDVVAAGLSETFGAIDLAADGALLLTGDDSRSVYEDMAMAGIGLASVGIARGLSKGAELVGGMREAREAVELAETTRTAKLTEAQDAVDAFNSAKNVATNSASDAEAAQRAADRAGGYGDDYLTNVANASARDATAANEAADKAAANAVDKIHALHDANTNLAAKLNAEQASRLNSLSNVGKNAKSILSSALPTPSAMVKAFKTELPSDVIDGLRAQPKPTPWVNLSALKGGSFLGKVEVGLGTGASVLNVGAAGATLPGLHSTLENISGAG